MQGYEDGKGLQYHEKPVHLDSVIVGSIIATVTQLQRELREAKDARQEEKDREVDARAHLSHAEDEVAQLKRDLSGSQDTMREAQENTREKEKAYHETLVLLKRARAENPASISQVDQALIQSLEEQLNNANQELRQLREERAPNAADGQMAVQQSQTNEQLEALCAEGEKLCQAIQKLAAECDSARQATL